MKMIGLMLLMIGMVGAALAQATAPAPEIDGGSATSAILLLSGSLLVIKNRWKR